MRPGRSLPLLTSGLAAVGVLAAAPAQADVPTYTAVVVDAGATGAAWVIDESVATTPTAESITWTEGDATAALTLPTGAVFDAGSVSVGTTQDGTTGTLSLATTAGGTCAVVGTLTVTEAVTDAGGVPTAYAADFAGTCDAQGPRPPASCGWPRDGDVRRNRGYATGSTSPMPTSARSRRRRT